MSVNPNDKIKALFTWCVNITQGYENVTIKNFTSSWKNGLGFCAILHQYDPDLIDFYSLNPENVFENCELAFNVAEKYFGIPSLLCARDMEIMSSPDRLCIITYLSQYYNTLVGKSKKLKLNNNQTIFENSENETRNTEEKNLENNDRSTIEERSDNQRCAICSETIYFLEKLTINDTFYHRSCYRQNQLINLKKRNKTLERVPKDISGENNQPYIKEEQTNSPMSDISQSEIYHTIYKNQNIVDKQITIPHEPQLSEKVFCRDDFESIKNQSSNDSSIGLSKRSFSIESISHDSSESQDKTDKYLQQFQNKLQPSSLDNSLNSLNSSNKKRPAPKPPVSKAKPKLNLLKLTKSLQPLTNKNEELYYPDELNPFAIEDETISVKPLPPTDNNNPFAEYMTEEISKIEESHNTKPKRLAPKIPMKPSKVSISKSSESIVQTNKSEVGIISSMSTDEVAKISEQDKVNVKESKISNNSLVDDCNSMISKDITVSSNLCPSDRLENLQENLKTDSCLSINKSEEESDKTKTATTISSSENVISYHSENLKIYNEPSVKINGERENITINSENYVPSHSDNNFDKSNDKRPQTVKKLLSRESLCHSPYNKNSVSKPPAPPRPLPPKREVRGDTSYEFIPYESLYFQLNELNEKQSKIESQGRSLQNKLWEADQNDGNFEEMLQIWLELVQEKNELFIKEGELHAILKRQELEDRHSDLEYELRLLMGKQESLKTAAEKAREEELITQILDTVNARAQLAEKNDEDTNLNYTDTMKKSKNTLKKIFSIKRRSSSAGKNQRHSRSKPFKFNKKNRMLQIYNLN